MKILILFMSIVVGFNIVIALQKASYYNILEDTNKTKDLTEINLLVAKLWKDDAFLKETSICYVEENDSIRVASLEEVFYIIKYEKNCVYAGTADDRLKNYKNYAKFYAKDLSFWDLFAISGIKTPIPVFKIVKKEYNI